MGPRDVAQLRRAMRDLQIIGEPGWSAAVSGDAAEAIGIAIRMAFKTPCAEPVIDLVMSAVLGAAIEGDDGARHFVTHMLRKRDAVDPLAERLAASWIAANGSPAQARRASRPRARMRPPPGPRATNHRPNLNRLGVPPTVFFRNLT